VSDLVRAHCDALAYLRGGGVSATLNCGYGRGFSVLEVIETVKRVSGADFEVAFAGRRAGDPAQIVAASDRARLCSNGSRFSTTCDHRVPRAGMGAQAFDARRLTSVDTADVCSPFSKPSCLGLPALRLRFSNPQRTWLGVEAIHRAGAVRHKAYDRRHITIHFILISDQTYPFWRQAPSNLDRRRH
jgi:hypothetical protein